MGGTNKTETTSQSAQTSPWGPAQPLLQGILGKLGATNTDLTGRENAALSGLSGNAGFLRDQFGGQATGLANTLLAGGGPDRTGMVSDAYGELQGNLGATARGDYLDPGKNPWFNQVTQNIGNDVQKRLSAMYAGSGRDPTGAGSFGQNLGRGISEGVAPVFSQMYDAERGRQMGAASGLFGGAGQAAGLLSGMDQTRLGNQQAGLGAAETARGFQNDPYNQQLAIEAQRRGIPLSVLQQITGMGAGIAGLGSSSTGSKTTESSTPFNPLSLAPLALMPFTGGTSMLGMGAGALGSGLFSGLSNGFMGGGNWITGR